MSSYQQHQYNPRGVGGQPPQLHQPQITAVNRSVQQPYGQQQPSPSLPRTDVMLADHDDKDRDPNDMNEYLMVTWDNVIAEPEGIRSTDCACDCSQQCFNVTSNCCYILLTTLLAPFAAFFCALNFAMCSFMVILTLFRFFI